MGPADRRRVRVTAGAVALVVVIGAVLLQVRGEPPARVESADQPRAEVVPVESLAAHVGDQVLGAHPGLFRGTFPVLRGLADPARQERINREMFQALAAPLRQTVDETRSAGIDLRGYDLVSRVHFLDDRIYSVEIAATTISPGATHPLTGIHTFVIAVRDGRKLDLADFFLPVDFTLRDRIAQVVDPTRLAEATAGSGDEDPPWLYRTYLVDDTGVALVYSPCALDSCAAGRVSVFVGYPDLVGLVDPQGPSGPYL